MPKWFGQSTSGYESIDNGGKLKHYATGKSDPSPLEISLYFDGIPNYIGNTIPTVLNRTRTLLPNDYNYLFFSEFLYCLKWYGKEDTWIVAGLLSLTRSSEPGGIFAGIARTFREGTIKKQIICKRLMNTVVCIINVTDSEKSHGGVPLNELFKGKILTIYYPPSTKGNNADSFIVKVYSYSNEGIQEDTNIMDPPTLLDNPTPKLLTVSGLEKIIAPSRGIVAADPNKVLDVNTRIVGFEYKTISEIDDIVQKIISPQALDSSAPAPAPDSVTVDSSGGNRMKKTKSKLKKRRRSRRHRPNNTRKLKKRAHKTSRRRSVRSCYKK
jgi:hypothetical protein